MSSREGPREPQYARLNIAGLHFRAGIKALDGKVVSVLSRRRRGVLVQYGCYKPFEIADALLEPASIADVEPGRHKMLALTVWQPWAALIVHGMKSHEYRRYVLPKRIIGQKVVVHAGAQRWPKDARYMLDHPVRVFTSCGPVVDLAKVQELLGRMLDHRDQVPVRAGIGTVVFGEPVPAAELAKGFPPEMLPGEPDPYIWGWPIQQVELWDEPIPARGNLGFWPWSVN